jgi:hypothetical protein
LPWLPEEARENCFEYPLFTAITSTSFGRRLRMKRADLCYIDPPFNSKRDKTCTQVAHFESPIFGRQVEMTRGMSAVRCARISQSRSTSRLPGTDPDVFSCRVLAQVCEHVIQLVRTCTLTQGLPVLHRCQSSEVGINHINIGDVRIQPSDFSVA